ncbi:MAG: hypothetical protein KJ893_00905 [Candidatus Omnitrophica bacterium]|nr:hypothetical protein [Candidatus Omnitrophota bacterium]MBU4479158.1 hypothetical protein [Candidatus Omnitrophota bacterium]MCG2702797.1 hypothetical protein [Candidatus Omnitrophota bacterium]
MIKRNLRLECIVALCILITPFCCKEAVHGQELVPGDERMEHQTMADSDSSSAQTVSAGLLSAKDSLPYVSDASSIACTKETVEGLRMAGYSLNEIVDNLAKNGNNAHTISMALLSTGDYSGQEIYTALLSNEKFSKREADAAVPLGIRNAGQLFSPFGNKNNSKYETMAEDIRIQPNPFSSEENITDL